MPAPVNVKLQTPTVFKGNWEEEARKWKVVKEEAGANPDFYPLTIKAMYVIGVIHDICESVTILLRDPKSRPMTYIPAYGVFASGIELLGRCLQGNASTSKNVEDLKRGFKWLACPRLKGPPSDQHILIMTSSDKYSIDMLTALRHFAAHGQATSGELLHIGPELLGMMPPLIARGLECYWNELQSSEDLCNRLAQANVIAFRSWPVYRILSLFEKTPAGHNESITEIFSRFDWRLA